MISEANQNFSRVARMVDENGAAITLKNNAPRYVLIEVLQEYRGRISKENMLKIAALSRVNFRRIKQLG
ncbi:hypothetical protein [Clostridium sp. ATCC 25772]|uniref:hypothetical protein n=1 Tax=Clostridium sp. ATCC 25772 TaxID=1676991 RepID=UPI000784C918|nr:hypothetical protein [Clostridium sp. ATCC 25772]